MALSQRRSDDQLSETAISVRQSRTKEGPQALQFWASSPCILLTLAHLAREDGLARLLRHQLTGTAPNR